MYSARMTLIELPSGVSMPYTRMPYTRMPYTRMPYTRMPIHARAIHAPCMPYASIYTCMTYMSYTLTEPSSGLWNGRLSQGVPSIRLRLRLRLIGLAAGIGIGIGTGIGIGIEEEWGL